MPLTKCGFNSSPNDPTLGAQLLIQYGPTLIVSIGFDPNYNPATPTVLPIPGIVGVDALVDTGASESCIDSLLAAQLNLPVVDKRPISGIHGERRSEYASSSDIRASARVHDLRSLCGRPSRSGRPDAQGPTGKNLLATL